MNYTAYVNQLFQEISTYDHKTVKNKEFSLARTWFKPCVSMTAQLCLIEELLRHGDMHLFSIATSWIKLHPELIDETHIECYERCLYAYVDTWAKCDQYCYRVLNPMIERFPSLWNSVLTWATAPLPYVKRASAVCLIHSSTEFTVNVDFLWIETVGRLLLSEEHVHVRKGLGWLLKYSYLSYPEKTVAFIQENLPAMSSVTFHYALEKMPEHIKASLRKISKCEKKITESDHYKKRDFSTN